MPSKIFKGDLQYVSFFVFLLTKIILLLYRVPVCDHWKDPLAQFPQVSIANTDMRTFLILLVADIQDKKLQFYILNKKT